ncbi:MAG TPA: DUF411 domain-containing protein [Longimicrobium sp.]|nr:DUF411 domain-containing protein [Longimicrobium sp.]
MKRFAPRAAVLALAAAVAACAAPPEQTRAAEAVPAKPVASAAARASGPSAESSLLAVVYKTPSCGCCAKWVEHLEGNGFKVEVHDIDEVEPVKVALGVPGQLASCHTSKVGDYVFEGHVPAETIQRVLREKPAAAGFAVPGMPMGSPGMEGPTTDRYDVVAFNTDGTTRVYESH